MSTCTAATQRILLFVVACVSIATGLWINRKAVHEDPKPDLEAFGALNLAQAREALGFPDYSLLMCSGPKCERFERMLMTLIYVFKLMNSGKAGHGGFMVLLSMSLPLVLAMCAQALKPETTFLQRGISVTIVILFGQVFCLGASVPLLYIPITALVRSLDLLKTFPERPYGKYAPFLIKQLVTCLCIMAVVNVLAPMDHWTWPYINFVFQFSPLIMLSLSVFTTLFGRQKSVTTTKVSIFFEDDCLVSAAMYWYGMYHLLPTLGRWYRGEDLGLNDGEKLILWDNVGIFLTLIYWVVVDGIADYQLMFEQTRPLHRVPPTAWILGIIRSIFIAVLFGPGVVMDLYFAGREDAVTPVHSFIKQDLPKQKRS